MTNPANNKNTPQLRFPEFSNDGEWEEKTLGEVYSFKVTNSFPRDLLNYEKGNVKNIHYGDIHTKFSTLFDIRKEVVPFINTNISIDKIKSDCYCLEGDMIFADASEDLKDVGKSIEIVELNNEKLLSGLHTLLARQIKPKLAIGFGGHLFVSNIVRSQIQKESQGAKVLGISAGRLSKIEISYPTSTKEQQKIADCLSSLDELIAAQAEKVEALKTHKKALMQQLFPTEGETLPKLRFKEFENDGEWEEKALGKVFSIFNGYAFSSAESVGEGVLWVKIADVGIQEMKKDTLSFLPLQFKDTYSKFLLKKGDYVVALTRPILNRKLKIAQIDDFFDGSLLNQRVGKIETKNNKTFIYYYLQKENLVKTIEDNIAGSDPPNLSPNEVNSIELLIPQLQEQQKIANCISSIDEQIAAESERLSALKVHKKGLMQGLFTNSEEKHA